MQGSDNRHFIERYQSMRNDSHQKQDEYHQKQYEISRSNSLFSRHAKEVLFGIKRPEESKAPPLVPGVITEPVNDTNLPTDQVLDLRSKSEQTLYFEVTDFLLQQVQYREPTALDQDDLGTDSYERNIKKRKDMTLRKLSRFVQISRTFMEFLGQGDERGSTKAFLYDQMIKSLLLVVDEVIESFDRYAKDHVSTSVRRMQVRVTYSSSNRLIINYSRMRQRT